MLTTFNPLFKLHTEYEPAGDQPAAIESLVEGLNDGLMHQTLLGVTGSGKTFTMANVIAQTQRPTIIMSQRPMFPHLMYLSRKTRRSMNISNKCVYQQPKQCWKVMIRSS